MSRRPLVFVIGLTLGDYFLWNWSLNHNHDVIALIAGLAFPPLALMLLWMLAVGTARLLAHVARRPAARSNAAARGNAAMRRGSSPGRAGQTGRAGQPARATTGQGGSGQGRSAEGSREGAPARRIAA